MIREYSKYKPFRFWCQKVLPLVYDDSLSYYELLNKVVDYLNHIIKDVNAVGTAFEELNTKVTDDVNSLSNSFAELQAMVTNYFENLDVQEEINNKLDSMAEDGTLDALIQPLVDSAVGDAVSEWLEENVNPAGSAVVVDSSLTISGAAADAKITGDEIRDLKSDLGLISSKDNLALYNSYPRSIGNSGIISGNSNYRTAVFRCEPNTTYLIENPAGGYLVLGSDSEITGSIGNAYTLPNYVVPDSLTDAKITTGATHTYLFVCYWRNSYSEGTYSEALERLLVYRLSAHDSIARGKISFFYDDAIKSSPNLYNPSEHLLRGMNLQTTGVIIGTYADRCVIGYIPVAEFDQITVSILSPINTGGTRYCWYNENKEPIQISGSSPVIGGIPRYGELNYNVLSVPSEASYIAFLLYYANCDLDEDGAPKCMIQSGASYTGYSKYNGTLINTPYNRPKDVYVCASDSASKYRNGADYYCNGANDELTIQSALNSVGENGTLWLAPGTYSIDSFPLQSDGQRCAVQYKTGTINRVKIRCYDQTPTRREGYSIIRNCATLKVSESCYNSLDSATIYSVIGVETANSERVWNGAIFDVEGIGVQIPGNQKNIIAFDAYYAFCMLMFKCMGTAIKSNAMPTVAGVDNCIGIRCTKGSNFGQASQLTTCAMYGFGQGVAVMGEHYVLTNVKTIYNKYGFTFNWFGSTDGGYTHPNTLINCCSEMDFNYPYFGENTQGQSLTFVDFNMEHRDSAFALGGNLATELTPGSWGGTINYTIKVYGSDGYPITGNSTSMPFWKTGHGANMKSRNDAQKQICTTTERESYAANQMQRVFDTTENKFYTYVNGGWINA